MPYAIKNLQTFRSRNGYGFNATLYRDGKKIAHVSDEGRGGCYMIDFVPGVDVRAERALLDAEVAKMPPESFTSNGVTQQFVPDLDMLLSSFVTVVEEAKETKRLIKLLTTTCMFTDPSKPGILQLPKANKPCPELYANLRKRYPEAVILNELPQDDELALIRAHQKGEGA